MTDILVAYVKNTAFDASGDGNELIVFYDKLILKLQHRLNPIKYAIITISCSRQHESKFPSNILANCRFFRYRGLHQILGGSKRQTEGPS